MDCGAVGGAGHQPVEHVELAHQMALADPADRRVARHLADILGAEADQADASAAARRRSRGLAAGMTAANDQDVKHRRRLTAAAARPSKTRCFT